jgi:hypothetical protein
MTFPYFTRLVRTAMTLGLCDVVETRLPGTSLLPWSNARTPVAGALPRHRFDFSPSSADDPDAPAIGPLGRSLSPTPGSVDSGPPWKRERERPVEPACGVTRMLRSVARERGTCSARKSRNDLPLELEVEAADVADGLTNAVFQLRVQARQENRIIGWKEGPELVALVLDSHVNARARGGVHSQILHHL